MIFFFCLSFLLIFLGFLVFGCKGKENTKILEISIGICINAFAFSLVRSVGALRPKNICVNFINFFEAPNLEGYVFLS